MKRWSFLSRLVAMAVLGASLLRVEAAPGPIRVSSNGRYFVDARGEPFYFLADTQWELFRRYSLSDAKLILENRKAKGFTVVMVMLTGVGSGTGPNLAGQRPWLNDNPATPNPDYFAHVDAVVKLAQENDLHLTVLKNVFTGLREWWTLMPDQSVVTSGGNTQGDVLNLGARSTAGKWIISYVASQTNITVNLAKITAADSASAEWIDPVTGKPQSIGRFPTRGSQSFTRRADWQDAVLVVKAVETRGQ